MPEKGKRVGGRRKSPPPEPRPARLKADGTPDGRCGPVAGKGQKRRGSIQKGDVLNPAGRPQAYSDEEIIEAIRAERGLVLRASKRLGCHTCTIRNRALKSPAIREAIDFCRGLFVDDAENVLITAVADGDPKAAMYVTSTLGRDRGYVTQKESRIGQDPNAPPLIPPEDGEARREALRRMMGRMSVEAQREMVAAMRAVEAEEAVPPVAPSVPTGVGDGEAEAAGGGAEGELGGPDEPVRG